MLYHYRASLPHVGAPHPQGPQEGRDGRCRRQDLASTVLALRHQTNVQRTWVCVIWLCTYACYQSYFSSPIYLIDLKSSMNSFNTFFVQRWSFIMGFKCKEPQRGPYIAAIYIYIRIVLNHSDLPRRHFRHHNCIRPQCTYSSTINNHAVQESLFDCDLYNISKYLYIIFKLFKY